jgi:hypothetical protein
MLMPCVSVALWKKERIMDAALKKAKTYQGTAEFYEPE